MGHSAAWQRSILIVEDEPLIALDIATEFQDRGARVQVAQTSREALLLIEMGGIAAAIVDHKLAQGNSTEVCKLLGDRRIPFLIYSGVQGVGDGAVVVDKPAPARLLVSTVEDLLLQRSNVARVEGGSSTNVETA